MLPACAQRVWVFNSIRLHHGAQPVLVTWSGVNAGADAWQSAIIVNYWRVLVR